MNSKLKSFLIALITIGCIYFLFFNKPKYSFTIPPTVLMFFRAQCSGLADTDPDDAWLAKDYCTIVACHDDNYDEKSCSEIEPLLKVANEKTKEYDPGMVSPYGDTIADFERFLNTLDAFLGEFGSNPGGYGGGGGDYGGGAGGGGDYGGGAGGGGDYGGGAGEGA